MPRIRAQETAQSVLRFIFDDAVLSFDFAAEPSLGEIALKMNGISNRHFGELIAIDVTLGKVDKPLVH